MNYFYLGISIITFIIVIFLVIVIFLINNKTITKKIFDDRIKFYLGDIINNTKDKIDLNNYEYNEVSILYDNIKGLKNYTNGNQKRIYNEPLTDRLNELEYYDKKFALTWGDVITEVNIPSFCKNRFNNTKNTILKCLNQGRHWGLYYDRPKDIIFENKMNKIIWRGATTGFTSRPGNRFKLVEEWFDKNENIDIGFSLIAQNKHEYVEHMKKEYNIEIQDNDQYKKYLKNELNPEEMLKYKYILSVEGNDKDSGLNWKLNSNSVILMAKPRFTSWLMETTLIPNYHYVLLKDDFSDLEEKYEWCEKNQDKCKEIVKNANKFMEQFKDYGKEIRIENEVIRRYFEAIKQN